MAITTTYGLFGGAQFGANSFLAPADVAFLANGNFAIMAPDEAPSVTLSNLIYYSPSGSVIFSTGPNLIGSTAVVAGLAGGGTAFATHSDSNPGNAFSIRYGVRDNAGGTVFNLTNMNDLNSIDPAICALSNGGFAIVSTDTDGVDSLNFNIFNAAGTSLFALNLATSADASSAAVVQLENGNIALMWSQSDGAGGTDMWMAVYSVIGTAVVAPKSVDTAGTVNRQVSISALVGGGFLAVYEDNGWGSGTDITLAKFSDTGVPTGFAFKNLSDAVVPADGSVDARPDIARVFGNLFAVTWDHQGSANGDIGSALIDGDTGLILQGNIDLVGNGSAENLNSSAIAANTSTGQIVVVSERIGTATDLHQHAHLARIITGDAAIDAIIATSDLPHALYGEGGADKLTGNLFDDRLYGGEGNDKLDGKAGADTMEGGAGNDTYTVDNLGDIVTEGLNGGTDSVSSSVNHTLSANVEKLTLTGTAATGEGNALNNTLFGNSSANTLRGFDGKDTIDGKGGGDTMEGGLGDDTYTVDNVGDSVTELFNQGKDTVKSSISYLLGADVENLTLTGAGAINGQGNGLINSIKGNNSDNVLEGFAANDTLNGANGNDTLNGGTGKDRLTGGTGADRFVFDNIGDSSERDDITDFVSGSDRIVLDKADFTAFAALASGATITAADFVLGTAAVNPNQNIIYNSATGALFYDQDGSGAAFSQVQIAQLTGAPALVFSDIVIL